MGRHARLVHEQHKVVLLQRTGYGKSAAYWLSTGLRRSQGHGPTLVISPLLALMRDQVAAAERSGIRAATLNSVNIEGWPVIEQQIAGDIIDVLLISPERLNSPASATEFCCDSLPGSG